MLTIFFVTNRLHISTVMPALMVLFRYWLFASAFMTIYVLLDALIDSLSGFEVLLRPSMLPSPEKTADIHQ